MNNVIRPLPRHLSPRLPIGRRWERFCRSAFVGHLRESARAAFFTVAMLSTVVVFFVGTNAAWAVYTAARSVGGAA